MTTKTNTDSPKVVLHCSTAGHRHYGKSAEIRDPGHAIDADRACALIDLAWHPLLGRAASVQQHGPWRVEDSA